MQSVREVKVQEVPVQLHPAPDCAPRRPWHPPHRTHRTRRTISTHRTQVQVRLTSCGDFPSTDSQTADGVAIRDECVAPCSDIAIGISIGTARHAKGYLGSACRRACSGSTIFTRTGTRRSPVWDSVPDELDQESGAIVLILTFFPSRGLAQAYCEEIHAESLEKLAGKLRQAFPKAMTEYAWFGRTIQQALGEQARAARQPVARTQPKVGRNASCSYGSGRKYKKCCGANVH